jgi:D-alanyl-D-alanine dipeptidase
MTHLFRLIIPLALFLIHAGHSRAEGEFDRYLAGLGLVDVSRCDSTLRIDLKYATPDNFIGTVLYNGFTGAWLRPETAVRLLKAQRLLRERHPGYSLLIYDAARPMSVQRLMWNMVKGTGKINYVSNPANGGGLHNYGMAVDVTITDATGTPLPMGTPFDYFGEEAHTGNEEALLNRGKITREAFHNRRLLRDVMRQAGFMTIPYEWWHFNACTRKEAILKYPLID